MIAWNTDRSSDSPSMIGVLVSLPPCGVKKLREREYEIPCAFVAGLAAVIGRRCDFALLRAAGNADERVTAKAVEEMVRHRILQTVGDELDFTHDHVRDGVYARLLPPRRQLLHRAVAEALEGMNSGPEQIEQVAYHALRGELGAKAVGYLRQAGDKAAARSALQDARAWYGQALGVLGTLPESRSTLEAAPSRSVSHSDRC